MTVEILTPASRDEWIGLRGHTIGASESAALFGVHPWMTAYELHHLKSGTITADPAETGPMRRGRLLEQVAVDFLREERPDWKVTANRMPGGKYYRDLDLGLSATPDAFVEDLDHDGFGICQIKSVEASVYRSRWCGDGGHVDVPLYVAVQAVQEAFLTGATWAVVCPLVIEYGIEMPVLKVPRHAALIDRLKIEAAAFWRGVHAGQPPDPDYAKDGALLERLWAGLGPEIDLRQDNEVPALVAEKEELSTLRGSADKRLKEIKSALFQKLGDAAVAHLADGRVITAKRIERSAYSVAPSSYIDLRIRKGTAA